MTVFKRRSSPNPDFWRLKEELIWSFKLEFMCCSCKPAQTRGFNLMVLQHSVPHSMQKALFGTSSLCWNPAWINHKQCIDNKHQKYYTE